jgi:hypothetical protein
MAEKIAKNNKIMRDNEVYIKEVVNLILKLKEIYEDRGEKPGEEPAPNIPLDQEEAKKLETLRNQAREAINKALNQSPSVSSNELSKTN